MLVHKVLCTLAMAWTVLGEKRLQVEAGLYRTDATNASATATDEIGGANTADRTTVDTVNTTDTADGADTAEASVLDATEAAETTGMADTIDTIISTTQAAKGTSTINTVSDTGTNTDDTNTENIAGDTETTIDSATASPEATVDTIITHDTAAAKSAISTYDSPNFAGYTTGSSSESYMTTDSVLAVSYLPSDYSESTEASNMDPSGVETTSSTSSTALSTQSPITDSVTSTVATDLDSSSTERTSSSFSTKSTPISLVSPTESYIGSSLETSSESQTEPQIESQTESKTDSQTESQIESQAESQIGSQIKSQIGSQTESQTPQPQSITSTISVSLVSSEPQTTESPMTYSQTKSSTTTTSSGSYASLSQTSSKTYQFQSQLSGQSSQLLSTTTSVSGNSVFGTSTPSNSVSQQFVSTSESLTGYSSIESASRQSSQSTRSQYGSSYLESRSSIYSHSGPSHLSGSIITSGLSDSSIPSRTTGPKGTDIIPTTATGDAIITPNPPGNVAPTAGSTNTTSDEPPYSTYQLIRIGFKAAAANGTKALNRSSNSTNSTQSLNQIILSHLPDVLTYPFMTDPESYRNVTVSFLTNVQFWGLDIVVAEVAMFPREAINALAMLLSTSESVLYRNPNATSRLLASYIDSRIPLTGAYVYYDDVQTSSVKMNGSLDYALNLASENKGRIGGVVVGVVFGGFIYLGLVAFLGYLKQSL